MALPGDGAYRDRRQARLERYSRAVRWLKIVLPVGAVLLIFTIFLAGRERATVLDPSTAADMAVLGSGMRLDRPRFSGTTEDGAPFVVTADWALPDGAVPDRIELEKPTGELLLDEERILTVNADTGALYRKRELLHLRGDVVLQTSDGYRVETPSVEVDLADRSALAPERLSAEGPRGRIEADRARVVRGEGPGRKLTLRFEGDVRVTYRPPPDRNGTDGSSR